MKRQARNNLQAAVWLIGLGVLTLPLCSCAHQRNALSLGVTEEALRQAMAGMSGPLKRALQEMFSERELRFFDWMAQEARTHAKRDLGAPGVIRSWHASLTYPSDGFPDGLPDGVWLVQTDDGEVPDRRFLREPVGHEVRSDADDSVRQVGVLARQRSNVVDRTIGEFVALGETLQAASA